MTISTNSLPNIYYKGCDSIEKEKLLSALKNCNLSFIHKDIVIIKINTTTDEDRLIVRKVVNEKNPFLILISSNIEVSNFAWQCQANYFGYLTCSDWNIQLANALKNQYLNLNLEYQKKLKIKTHKQIDIVDPVDIVVVLAQGNYSELRLSNGKKILVSKQIGIIEKELENWRQLERFGKSIIVNLNKITSIKNKTITFKNNEQFSFPKYSRSFVYLKNRLLWNK